MKNQLFDELSKIRAKDVVVESQERVVKLAELQKDLAAKQVEERTVLKKRY